MTKAKPKPDAVEAADEGVDPPDQSQVIPSVHLTKDDLQEALEQNMIRKLGAHPVEGQLDDLWMRLGGK